VLVKHLTIYHCKTGFNNSQIYYSICYISRTYWAINVVFVPNTPLPNHFWSCHTIIFVFISLFLNISTRYHGLSSCQLGFGMLQIIENQHQEKNGALFWNRWVNVSEKCLNLSVVPTCPRDKTMWLFWFCRLSTIKQLLFVRRS